MYQKRHDPTRFPHTTEVRLHTGVSQIEFPATFATLESFVAFKMNAKNLDAIALRDRAKEVGDAGLKVDDIRASVKAGVAFVEKKEFEQDGSGEFTCVRCLKGFQPIKKPKLNGGFSGNFRTLKADEVTKLDEARQRLANEVTSWFLGLAEGAAPSAELKTRVVPVCLACRKIETERVVREKAQLEREGSDRYVPYVPYLVIDDVVEALYARDTKIINAINRKAYDEVVSPRTDTRRTSSDNRPNRDNRDSRPGGRGNRPRGDRKAWHGVEYFPQVTDTLVRLVKEGKLEDSLEGLLSKSPAELEALGLEYAAKIQQLAQGHLDWQARQARTAEVAGTGRVTIGEAVARR